MEIVLACDEAWGIAKDGVMPWPRLACDMKHFKALTEGHCVVMGSTTWNDKCTPCPLPNRLNVVASTKEAQGAWAVISGDLPTAIKDLDVGDRKKFVIGGANLVHQVLPFTDVLHITMVKGVYNCDTTVYLDKYRHLFKTTLVRELGPTATYIRLERA